MSVSMRNAFTLVEILIVVLIIGILAAITVPQFASATTEAQHIATFDQLRKVRSSLSLYYLQAGGQYPDIVAGDGTWGQLLSLSYMREAPVNFWIGTGNPKVISLAANPDVGFQAAHGWIFNPANGYVWAGSFNGLDEPYPRP
ncbi:MAG: prepilin-type N-terminal cleavage/methylation domain-containing protein [Phycisphaerales bacterium]|jgi:prepilin-type N-terminal cleavage/methylation domain-containing protein